MAPEVARQELYGPAVDIYSLGCTVIEMASGAPPWAEFDQIAILYQISVARQPPPIPESLSPSGVSFVQSCLSQLRFNSFTCVCVPLRFIYIALDLNLSSILLFPSSLLSPLSFSIFLRFLHFHYKSAFCSHYFTGIPQRDSLLRSLFIMIFVRDKKGKIS